MRRPWTELRQDERGTVAPTVALSLVALLATGGLAFDYAHIEGMQSELIQAADQAVLGGASQLDGQTRACARASAAARALITNNSRFANDGNGPAVAIPDEPTCDAVGQIQFYQSWNQTSDIPGLAATADSNARVMLVTVNGRTTKFALTPIVGALNSGLINASAVASVGRAICKVPPVMICNPDEPSTNADKRLPFNATRGIGLSLIAGDAKVPGNFGWLVATSGNGASNLAGALGYNQPVADCQDYDGVTTKTGLTKAVFDAFNTRFDVFASGNLSCPSNPGGTCSPAVNTRKDLVCTPTGAACSSDSWKESSKPYRLHSPTTCTGTGGNAVCTTPAIPLPTDKSKDPNIMGYSHDMVQADITDNWGTYAIKGDGNWDRDAYFRVNYGWDHTTWSVGKGLSATATRFEVYQWELSNQTAGVGGMGIAQPQINATNTEGAYSYPATGRTGIAQSPGQPDRREMAVAVLNCVAEGGNGTFSAQPVSWLDVFLTEPVFKRNKGASGSNLYTKDDQVYAEVVGVTQASPSDPSAIVIRRDKPYLIK